MIVMLIVSAIAVVIYLIQKPKNKLDEDSNHKPWVIY